MALKKINIAVIAPDAGIGGCNRKFKIYHDNLPLKYFKKKYIHLLPDNSKAVRNEDGSYNVGIIRICEFLLKDKTDIVMLGKKLPKEIYSAITMKRHVMQSVTFLDNYLNDEKALNCFICKTDYYRFHLMHDNPVNAYVLYDPIDVDAWQKLDREVEGIYRKHFPKKRVIIGRLARAEPSKWNFLIIKTLIDLDRKNNYQYGFVFVGMPLLYRAALRLSLSGKMRKSILLLPEMSSTKNIAEFYKSIDLFWQTSKIGESFGDVIGEAFSFGIPVLSDYKDFFRSDGSVNPMLYNAQTELVDEGMNGAIRIYPSKVIEFLNQTRMQKLKSMGENGFKKVMENYDAKVAGETMAAICFEFFGKWNTYPKPETDAIRRTPSRKETEDWELEYLDKLVDEIEKNNIPTIELVSYKLQESLWSIIEFGYLAIRKVLRMIGIQIEEKARP